MSSVAQRRGAKGAAPVESTLSNLSLSGQKAAKQAAVADSWEDEADAASPDSSGPSTPTAPASAAAGRGGQHPNAPPPTPSSPGAAFNNPYALPAEFPAVRGRDEGLRPDKTTAAASRMIAGALGVRAPKKADDMRRYEQAAADKERARRDKDKADRDEAERRKRSAWED